MIDSEMTAGHIWHGSYWSYGSSGSTNLSGSRGSRVSTRDPLTIAIKLTRFQLPGTG